MRVLFSTGTPAGYMAPPILGDEQIVCGPDWTDEQLPDGSWKSLQTPVGRYDLSMIVSRLPEAQQPDVIVCLVDASWRNLPRNLGFFRGPKILLVADTHHMTHPIGGMLEYAASEPYDRIVFLYDRHHLPIFRAAGFSNLHWFPGLTFPHDDDLVRTANRTQRTTQIAFVGQAGQFHSRRARLLAALADARLPVAHRQVAQRDALKLYGSSLIGFNASLNGDLNLRILETLASGAMLLTDRLSKNSGLTDLWSEGKELITYADTGELVARAKYYLANPEAARAVGQLGAKWFAEHFSAEQRQASFQKLAFEGISPPQFEVSAEAPLRINFLAGNAAEKSSLAMYEQIQELHRVQEVVRVSVAEDVPADFANLCATLPRVQTVREAVVADGTQPDWRVVRDLPAANAVQPAGVQRLFCWDFDSSAARATSERLAHEGWMPVQGNGALFTRSAVRIPAAISSSAELLPLPRNAAKRGVVLLYSDEPNPHGVAHYNHSLLLALVSAGWTVCSAHPRFESPMIESQKAAGIRHYWTTWNWGQRFVNSMVDCAEPERILAAVNPDLVVFSDCWPISCIAAKHTVIKRDLPYLVVCHSGDLAPGRTFPASLKVAAAQFARAREVVTVAASSLKVLREHYGLAPEKGRVIWNGRPGTYFEPSKPEVNARLRQQLGLPENSVLCFTAARFDALKGYQFQFQAIQQFLARKRSVPVYFAWAGTGHLQEQFQAAINQQGLQDRIRLLGQQTNITEWLGAADIFILTTMLEAMPLSVLEAMAKGTPVIATNVGGIPEELAETGKLLPDPNLDPAGTVLQLVDTLEKWTANPALRKQIGLAGKKRAELHFREEITIEKTLTLIDEVAAGIAAPVGAVAE